MSNSGPSLSLDALKKASRQLHKAATQPKDEFMRDATIQRFEFTFELSWKTLKRYFRLNNNLEIGNLKDIFREAGKQGLIDSVESWFGYLEARNQTSHTYNEATAERTYEAAKQFSKDVIELIGRLEKLLA